MAEVNPPLYVETNDAYGADELGLPFRDIMGEGIVGATDLLVSDGGGLKSSVAAGAAWIKGDDDASAQPTYRVRNDAAVLLNHAAADATNPRIDLVIAEVLDAGFAGVSRLWRLRIVQGVPAAAPATPATPNDALALAQVRINAGSGTLTSVTDVRTRASVGGGAAIGGGMSQLYDLTLGADAPNFDAPNIPQGFAHLLIVAALRETAAATSDAFGIRLNGDAGANYDSQRWRINGASGAASEAFGETSARAGLIPGAGAAADLFGGAQIYIPGYALPINKVLNCRGSMKLGTVTNNMLTETNDVYWRSNAAINRITVIPGGGNFKAGSRVTIYGLR